MAEAKSIETLSISFTAGVIAGTMLSSPSLFLLSFLLFLLTLPCFFQRRIVQLPSAPTLILMAGTFLLLGCFASPVTAVTEEILEYGGSLDSGFVDFAAVSEQDGEILTFLSHVDALVDHHVERFIERGFEHLQVCFGCTGGQHRSVYSAEHLAKHLKEKYDVRVHLIHRERGVERMME